MKKVTIHSPANIAFIKYWGQVDRKNILPCNDSFSMNLSDCYTETEIELLENPEKKEFYLKNYTENDFNLINSGVSEKVHNFVQFFKQKYGIAMNTEGYIIRSANSFPISAGIASSASFFSSLAYGMASVYELNLSEKELSILSRLSGSGSACRSIPDGFAWWHKGTSSDTSYAESIGGPNDFDLYDIVVIVSSEPKKTSSQSGHTNAQTSPYFTARLSDVEKRSALIKKAFFEKDFTQFGELLEQEAISLHVVMMTQTPPLLYWSGATMSCIHDIHAHRRAGLEGYFTIDAGENVHLICEGKSKDKWISYLETRSYVKELIVNKPAKGTYIK